VREVARQTQECKEGAAMGFFRKLAYKRASPEEKANLLLDEYDSLTASEHHKRVIQILIVKPGWEDCVVRYITEMAMRLDSKEKIVKFIVLSELADLHTKVLPTISSHCADEWGSRAGYPERRFKDLDLAARLTAERFVLAAGRLSESGDPEAIQVAKQYLECALDIESELPSALCSLATLHYFAEDYHTARNLFERGLAGLEKERGGSDAPEEVRLVIDGYRSMYQECQLRS
jgi:hypothetical protein